MKTQIILIIMRAFESFCSPYLTDTWDGAAGNGADAIYSRQAWIYTERMATREDDHLLKTKARHVQLLTLQGHRSNTDNMLHRQASVLIIS